MGQRVEKSTARTLEPMLGGDAQPPSEVGSALSDMKKKKGKRARKKKKRDKVGPAGRRRSASRVKPIKGPFQMELPLQMPLFPGDAGGPLGPVGVQIEREKVEKKVPSHRQESLLGTTSTSTSASTSARPEPGSLL